MDFDEEMSGLQIEDLGEYFLQTEMEESWKGFSLGYVEEEKQEMPVKTTADEKDSESSRKAASSSSALFSSPTLSGFAALLKSDAKATTQSIASQEPSLSPVPLRMHEALPSGQEKATVASTIPDFALDLSPQLDPFNGQTQPTSISTASTFPSRSTSTAGVLQINPSVSSTQSSQRTTPVSGASKRCFAEMESCSSESCGTIAPPEDDRGFRKKSREKMRRQEVNVKFDELVELLGLSNRVRKTAILQEAVAAIKSLKRERDEMRRERDRLQQEVSKLATCLQYTHLGSVAAANAVAMGHMPQLQHMNAAGHMTQPGGAAAALSGVAPHAMHVPCAPGGACFPIGSTFSSLGPSSSAMMGGVMGASSSAGTATTTTMSGTCPIAPKVDKSSSSSNSTPHVTPRSTPLSQRANSWSAK